MNITIKTTDGGTMNLPDVVKVKQGKRALTVVSLIEHEFTDKFKLPMNEVEKFTLLP